MTRLVPIPEEEKLVLGVPDCSPYLFCPIMIFPSRTPGNALL